MHDAVALSTREQLGARLHCALNARLDALGVILRDDRPDKGRLVERIALLERRHLCRQKIAHLFVHLFVHENALNTILPLFSRRKRQKCVKSVLKCAPDAALSALVVRAKHDALGHRLGIGILIDDHRRVSAKLKHALFLARLCLEVVPDARRSREGKDLYAIIGDEQVAGGARAGEHREGAGRQRRRGKDLGEEERAHGRVRRGCAESERGDEQSEHAHA